MIAPAALALASLAPVQVDGPTVVPLRVRTAPVAPSTGWSALAVDPEDRTYLAYQTPERHLRAAFSTDGGITWEIRTIDQSSVTGAFVDAVAPAPGVAYVAYHDERARTLRFARTRDGGGLWLGFATVDRDGAVGEHASIAAPDEAHVFIAYRDRTTSSLELARSDDAGDTWRAGIEIDPGPAAGAWADLVALDERRLAVAYQDLAASRARLALSDDGGETWTRLDLDAPGGTGAYASLVALRGGELVAAYRDLGAGALRLARLAGPGAAGDVGALLASEIARGERAPAWPALVALADGGLACAYLDVDALAPRLARSDDGGASWRSTGLGSGESAVSDAGRHARLAALADGALLASWLERGEGVLVAARLEAELAVGFGVERPEARVHVRAAEGEALRVEGRSDLAGVTVTPEGALGVGVETPRERLHVAGRARFDEGGGTLFVAPSSQGTRIGTGRGESLQLVSGAAGLTVEHDGRVGVHTRTPRAALDVVSPQPDGALLALGGGPDVGPAVAVDGRGHVGLGTEPTDSPLTVRRGAAPPIADAWAVYSSERWKEDVRPLDGALERALALRAVAFRRAGSDDAALGLVAEQVAEVLPEAVQRDAEGRPVAIDYAAVTALLVRALAEQQERLDALQRRLSELEERR